MSATEPQLPATITPEVITAFEEDAQGRRSSSSSSLPPRPPLRSSCRDNDVVDRKDRSASTGKMLARRTLGIALLLVTVFMWTGSNFLASTIFADDTYSKPYFVTYVNTAVFVLPIFPISLARLYRRWRKGRRITFRSVLNSESSSLSSLSSGPSLSREESESFLKPDGDSGDDDHDHDHDHDHDRVPAGGGRPRNSDGGVQNSSDDHNDVVDELEDLGLPARNRKKGRNDGVDDKLNFRETSRLSFEFCVLWFVANYLAVACLSYTTVASATILTSTSSVWTLIFGVMVKVERFTLRKTLAVVASMAGIALISLVDLSGDSDKNRGSFPHKTVREIAIGDVMAFLSAILYGVYIILMRKRVGDESRVNMPLFFAFIGIFNLIAMWPGFITFHLLGIEKFELPPNGRVWNIIMINGAFALISDICWAYAMLLTSPLVVTVGLSLTIPLSLIGQMILDSQFSSVTYWFGAAIVFLSFIIVNRESKQEEETTTASGAERAGRGLLSGTAAER